MANLSIGFPSAPRAGVAPCAATSIRPPLGFPPKSGPFFGLLYGLKQAADALGISAGLGKTLSGKLALFLD